MPKPKNKKVTNAKNKGREFGKRIRQLFVDAFDLKEEEARCPVGYEQGCDVKFLEEAQKRVGVYIECKNQAQISLGSWLTQAVKNTPKDGVPALIFHKQVGNQHKWVCLPLSHYLDIRGELFRGKEYAKKKYSTAP